MESFCGFGLEAIMNNVIRSW